MLTARVIAYCLVYCVATVLAEGKAWWWQGDRKPIPPETRLRWINPCGVNNYKAPYKSIWEFPASQRRTGQEWKRLITVTRQSIVNARESFETFRQRYVKETFQVDFFSHNKEWEKHDYNWLPNIPKKLGEPVPRKQLERPIYFDLFVKLMTQWLQIVDVGLEQVLWDWNLETDQGNPKYKDAFKDMWHKNNLVLCDMWKYGKDLGLNIHDVNRSIMPNEFRDIQDETTRNIRDWIIFKSYMNLLEYMADVLKYFLDKDYGLWFDPGYLSITSKMRPSG
ncbi:uncharacterized protein LOC128993766 isoform X2 [Macrosteles quadrilineatus]|uniref:uncharacterized protein LOC128993766 isoform X2 n=1 Tax=Macrosteles quadrilineatus TaxID=74068 RepID=UPI0023E1FE8C|nr:uncharacterized protein LOC128993766 isoform X2 [Macrosteles quadrilineatus]